MKLYKQTKDYRVYQLTKDSTFAQMFSEVLEVGKTLPIEKLALLLKPHCLTGKQIDALIENAEEVGLEMTGWQNFIPTLKDGEVSVVCAYWHDGRWHRSRHGLDDGDVWLRDARLVVSNSVTWTLKPSDPSTLEARVKALEDWKEKTFV